MSRAGCGRSSSGDLPGGIYHMCNAGGCSWHEYGQFALDFAARAGLPLKARKAEPIPLSALKAFVAPRPPHTEMSTAKFTDGDRDSAAAMAGSGGGISWEKVDG